LPAEFKYKIYLVNRMKRIHLIIKGRVQGVGYRFFIRLTASKLGLKGYVKNLYSGEVEVVAEGEEEKLKKLIQECRKGTFLSRVDNIEVSYEKATNEFDGFSIQH